MEWYRNGHKMSAIDGTTLTIPTAAGGGDDTSALGVYQCFIVNMTGPTVAQYRILPYGQHLMFTLCCNYKNYNSAQLLRK